MATRNYNTSSKKKQETKPAWLVKNERMYDLLELIEEKKELKYFDIQRILQWGDGITERITREVLAYYSHRIRFDKEKRTFYSIDMKIKNEVIKN